jgi:hypothetical protein
VNAIVEIRRVETSLKVSQIPQAAMTPTPSADPNVAILARWPTGLIIYLLLLFAESIGLNWCGYLVSNFSGNLLALCFFLMMGAYGYYHYKFNRSKKTVQKPLSGTKNTPSEFNCQQAFGTLFRRGLFGVS